MLLRELRRRQHLMTALAPTTEHSADVELARLESEVGEAEARLDHDLTWASRKAVEVAAQLGELRVLGDASPRSPPVFQEADAREHLREARQAALERRRAACVAVRAALEAFSTSASRFAGEVGRDAAALRARRARPPTPLAVNGDARPSAPPTPLTVNGDDHAYAPTHRPSTPLGVNGDARPPASPPLGASRRASPRRTLQASIDLASDSNFYAGFSTDISEGGLFVATVTHPARGEAVDLRFSLGDEVIEARGVVRWTREVNDCTPDVMPGAGIQFVELGPAAAAAIHAFISQRDPLFFVEE
jgi:uncharacterized protein (TIGR02266 family)